MSTHINTARNRFFSASTWLVQDPRRISILVAAMTFTVTVLAAVLGFGGDLSLVAGPMGGGSSGG